MIKGVGAAKAAEKAKPCAHRMSMVNIDLGSMKLRGHKKFDD